MRQTLTSRARRAHAVGVFTAAAAVGRRRGCGNARRVARRVAWGGVVGWNLVGIDGSGHGQDGENGRELHFEGYSMLARVLSERDEEL
jgi:hypothetical protein